MKKPVMRSTLHMRSAARHVLPISGRPCASNISRWRRSFCTSKPQNAKRVSKKSVKELVQGPIAGEPLPLSDKTDLKQEPLLDIIKKNMKEFSNCVMLTKVGNFYELYHEHAEQYAPMLGLRVAAKGKEGVAMAGFQYQYLDKYLKKLVQELDKHVAICEEFPVKDKHGKVQSPIPRRVTRVVTPGTLVDEDFIDQEKNNFLLSVHCQEDQPHIGLKNVGQSFGLAWIDISTGEFYVQTVDRSSLPSALMRVGATEVVLSDTLNTQMQEEIALCLNLPRERLAVMPKSSLDVLECAWAERLDQPLSEDKRAHLSDAELAACQYLFDYVDKHVLEIQIKPQPPQRKEQIDTMNIDRSSIRGLELLKTARDGLAKGSLLHSIQRTVTKGGARLLRERLLYPSITKIEIEQRLNLVTLFKEERELRNLITVHLRQIYDAVRLAQKLMLNRGDADEMLCLAKTVLKMKDVMTLLEPYSQGDTELGRALKHMLSRFVQDGPLSMADKIKASIDEQSVMNWLASSLEAGNIEAAATEVNDVALPEQTTISQAATSSNNEFTLVMRRGASPELEILHAKLDQLHHEKLSLQEHLRSRLGTPKLLLKHDPKYGHICQMARVKGLSDEQLRYMGATLVGNLSTIKKFYLPEWTQFGKKIEISQYGIRQEEQRIFEELRQLVVQNLVALRQNASVMSELDLVVSFATLAEEEGWTRPIISAQNIHNIVGGRHPTVKLGLQEKGKSFVSNDLNLDAKARSWLITGPNMAGKSTFLRQNALITILAQIGSYVPASFAEIGIVDKMFSRIGAADDLFRNESTFMVEMLETASILRDATERSFVIMDEVGRGTAPEDGTAVAFASLHHLYYTNKCRTLFATHFHELADRTDDWPQLAQYCTDLFEDESGSFTFIHKLRPGVNRKSHALKVAEIAGLPRAALDVAHHVLQDTPN